MLVYSREISVEDEFSKFLQSAPRHALKLDVVKLAKRVSYG